MDKILVDREEIRAIEKEIRWRMEELKRLRQHRQFLKHGIKVELQATGKDYVSQGMRARSERYEMITQLLSKGHGPTEIGQIMGLKARTIKNDLRELYREYGITDGQLHVKLAVALYYETALEPRLI